MKKTQLVSVGLISALALSACGGEDGDSADPQEAPQGEEVAVQPELNIAYNAQPPTLDPLLATAQGTRVMMRTVFEPLIALDNDLEPQPVLAEDFELSEDATTLTFTLREDVTFHNGDPMTEEDVIASFERWAELTLIGQSFFDEAEFASPEAGVFTVTLPQGVSVLPNLIADPAQMPFIMPADIVEAAGDTTLDEHIGTGPYELGVWETDQYLRMDRFEDYVSPDGEPSGLAGEKTAYYEEMYFHFVSDPSTRMTGVQTGEYDVAHPLPLDNVDQLDSQEDVDLILGDSGLGLAAFNQDEGIMTDINMRMAVVAAMDPDAALNAAYVSDEFYTNNSALMPEDSPWYVPADAEFEELHQNPDLEAADEYLEEAGYDGETIRIQTTNDFQDLYDLGLMLHAQLEDAGMNAELLVHDWPTLVDIQDDPGAYEIIISGLINWPTVPATAIFLNPGYFNYVERDEIVEARESFIYSTEDEEAMAAMEDLQNAWVQHLPIIKFGDRFNATGQRSDLTGYEGILGVGEIFHHIRPAE